MPLGLYVSRCRGAVDEVLDVESLAATFAEQAACVRVVDDFFSGTFPELVAADVDGNGIDAVVLAGNSVEHFTRALSAPFTVQRIVEAGVNPNRLAYANLLEQVALPHAFDRAGAAVKAEALVREAVLRASSGAFIEPSLSDTCRTVVVLGASRAGIVAAQRLLRLGHPVVIADRGDVVERFGEERTRATAAFVSAHPQTTLVSDTRIADADGWAGDFSVTLAGSSGPKTVHAGAILLAMPADPGWVAEIRAHFPLDVDDAGCAQTHGGAAHPAETGEPGIMLVPPHDADDLHSVLAAADSAVLALSLDLASSTSMRFHRTSSVDEELCGACASCVKTCAFGACSIDTERGVSHVDPRRCHGCGKCVVSCPVGARDIIDAPHNHLLAAIRLLAASPVSGRRVLGFLCAGCGYPAADRAGMDAAEGGSPYPASFLPLRITCGGRLDALYVLEAFKEGFDGVAVFRCREGHCRNRIGNLDMDRRINLLRTVLRSRALDDGRLRIIDVTGTEGDTFVAEVNGFYRDLEEMRVRGGERG